MKPAGSIDASRQGFLVVVQANPCSSHPVLPKLGSLGPTVTHCSGCQSALRSRCVRASDPLFYAEVGASFPAPGVSVMSVAVFCLDVS